MFDLWQVLILYSMAVALRQTSKLNSTQILYRGLCSLGLYFRWAKTPKLIPLKFLLQYKSYGE